MCWLPEGSRTVFVGRLDSYLLTSIPYFAFVLLAALHTDKTIDAHQGVAYAPIFIFNLISLLAVTQQVLAETATGDRAAAGLLWCFVLLWNLAFILLAFVEATFAARCVPLYIILCFGLCACTAHIKSEFKPGKFANGLCVCCGHCFTSVQMAIQFILIICKMDGAIDWRWRVVFVPMWILNLLTLSMMLTIPIFASHEETPTDLIVIGLLSWCTILPIMIMELLICAREESGISAMTVISPILVGWGIIILLRLGFVAHTVVGYSREYRAGIRQRQSAQSRTRHEKLARKVPATSSRKDPPAASDGGDLELCSVVVETAGTGATGTAGLGGVRAGADTAAGGEGAEDNDVAAVTRDAELAVCTFRLEQLVSDYRRAASEEAMAGALREMLLLLQEPGERRCDRRRDLHRRQRAHRASAAHAQSSAVQCRGVCSDAGSRTDLPLFVPRRRQSPMRCLPPTFLATVCAGSFFRFPAAAHSREPRRIVSGGNGETQPEPAELDPASGTAARAGETSQSLSHSYYSNSYHIATLQLPRQFDL
jgi:hypothetical protein